MPGKYRSGCGVMHTVSLLVFQQEEVDEIPCPGCLSRRKRVCGALCHQERIAHKVSYCSAGVLGLLFCSDSGSAA